MAMLNLFVLDCFEYFLDAYVLCHVCPPKKSLEDTVTVSTSSKEDKGNQLLEEAVWEARIKQYHQAATGCCLARKSQRSVGLVVLLFGGLGFYPPGN